MAIGRDERWHDARAGHRIVRNILEPGSARHFRGDSVCNECNLRVEISARVKAEACAAGGKKAGLARGLDRP